MKKEILLKYRNGDKLSDFELRTLRGDMRTVAMILGQYGDLFTITDSYCIKIVRDCDAFLRARKEGVNDGE